MKLKKIAFLALGVWGLAAFLCPVGAQNFFTGGPDDLIKSRTYFGGVGISTTIDQWDDFDGNMGIVNVPDPVQTSPTTIWGNAEISLIPKIGRNFGWGVLVGHREGPWAAEVSYWQSGHTAEYTGVSSFAFTDDSSLQSFDINFKRYFLLQLPTQPFISMGLSFPWLWVKDASLLVVYPVDPSVGYDVTEVSDSSISGIGFNLGAGLEIYLGDNFSIVGGIYQRWCEFNQINGAAKIAVNQMYFDENPEHVGSLAGKGLSFYIGTTIGLQ